MKLKFLIIFGMIIAFGASYFYLNPNPAQSTKNAQLKNTIITLKRYGRYQHLFPEYKLIIFENGNVIYDGDSNVQISGIQTSQISQEKVKELIDEFNKINYLSLKDSYFEPMAQDGTFVITSLAINGKVKRISSASHGGAPDDLNKLEVKIDEIVNSKKWVGECIPYAGTRSQDMCKWKK